MAIIDEIKKQIGRIMPHTPGNIHNTNLKKVQNERLSETIKPMYFIDMVTQAINMTTGATMRNVVNSLLKMYLKAIENIAPFY